jgi:SAM-dependent methyltransferase
MIISDIEGVDNGAKKEKKNFQGANKWDAVFKDDVKYRDLNEVFVLQLIDEFKASTGIKPAHVVDLGCGNGNTLFKFCARDISVTGIDFSVVALEEAKKKLVSCDGKADFIEADLENLDNVKIEVPAGTLWLCKLVLAFINDRKKFLKNVRDKMKAGDMLLIMTPILHDEIIYQKEDKPGIAIRQNEMGDLMLNIFGSKQVFSNEYTGERGHIVSYLVKI